MSTKVTADDFDSVVADILTEYCTKLSDKADAILKESADKCKNDIQSRSPVKAYGTERGKYKKGWRVSKTGKLKGVSKVGGYVVHNKTDYQLTHLLEYGHVSKNQYGTYGRVPAKPHIATPADKAIRECINNMRTEL